MAGRDIVPAARTWLAALGERPDQPWLSNGCGATDEFAPGYGWLASEGEPLLRQAPRTHPNSFVVSGPKSSPVPICPGSSRPHCAAGIVDSANGLRLVGEPAGLDLTWTWPQSGVSQPISHLMERRKLPNRARASEPGAQAGAPDSARRFVHWGPPAWKPVESPLSQSRANRCRPGSVMQM